MNFSLSTVIFLFNLRKHHCLKLEKLLKNLKLLETLEVALNQEM